MPLPFPPRVGALIADAWPHVRTRAGRECRSRGLCTRQLLHQGGKRAGGERTWALDVTDDGTGLVVHELDTALGDTTTGAYRDRRQPAILSRCAVHISHAPSLRQLSQISRTGSAKDTGDLDELDGSLS